MKKISLIFAIFMLSADPSDTLYAVEEPDSLVLEGKSLFSFTRDHFIIQTDKYFYKISKKGLAEDSVSKLENATLNSQTIVVKIPRKKIDYIWPAVLTDSNKKSEVDYKIVATELITEITENNGQINLKGNMLLSFSEPYYLIQVNDSVYQLKKSALTKKQIKEFSKISLGSRINISVPQTAVDYSWSFKQDVSRNIASIEDPDEIFSNQSYMTLRGTVLYSADEPVVIVQSKDLIYHLKRKGILTKNPKLLDIQGSKIQLTVPINDIEFFWSVDNSKLVENGPK